jgi:hypothetical protein
MKSSLPCWLLVLSIIAAPLAAQEIYRVVDEHGNVTYTDQKPDDDADPVNLPEINVLGEDDDPLPVDEPETEVAEPLRFTITSPTEGEVFSELAGDVRVEMEINLEVPPTTQIVIFLNGQPQEPVRSLDVTLEQLPPGDYHMRAELQTPGGRKMATTETVHFEVVASQGEP